jgi:hypothetical protein
MTSKSHRRRDSRADEARQKIRKVGQLIRLSRKIKAQRIREDAEDYSQSAFGDSQSVELPSKNSRK